MPRKQVTPETAQDLVEALLQLADRGFVQVSSRGIVGGMQLVGNLTCEYNTRGREPSVDCRMRGGIMSTPVTPLGFTPRRQGDVVAWYDIGKDYVHITYDRFQSTQGWRRFTADNRH